MTTPPKLSTLDDTQINQICAKALGFDLHVIIKRGLYYREGAHGYTACLCDAWKLPKQKHF